LAIEFKNLETKIGIFFFFLEEEEEEEERGGTGRGADFFL